jgi:tRNA (adenine57-N1/adenine58-N1)-methyltransferase
MMEKRLFLINQSAAFFVDPSKDFNTEFGILHSSDLKKAKIGSQVKTHKGIKFFVIEPTASDLIKKIIRLPQIITLKDLGSIIAYSGIKSYSKILEAGTGSGFSTCVLASVARNGRVISYEIRKDFAKVAKKNIELFGLDNVKIINADIKDGIKEKAFDFVLLDMPDPWKVVGLVAKVMKIGARICTYSPSIIQIEKTIKELPDTLKVERLMTVIENDWKVELNRDILRPQSDGLTHTAFMLFSRKVMI